MGVATGAHGFLRSLGAAIGIAVLGAVAAASGIVLGLGGAARIDGGAFMPVFAATAVALLLSLVCLLGMEERPLRGRVEKAGA
jgi:hypothetical protein